MCETLSSHLRFLHYQLMTKYNRKRRQGFMIAPLSKDTVNRESSIKQLKWKLRESRVIDGNWWWRFFLKGEQKLFKNFFSLEME